MTLDDLKNGRWEVLSSPVLGPSTSGWDSHSSMTPVVFSNSEMGIESSGDYGMLYVGVGHRSSAWGVGYASSDDLFSWQKNPGNPVLLQDKAASFQIDAPCLLRTETGLNLICEEKRIEDSLAASMRNLLSPSTKLALRALRRAIGLEKPTVVNHAAGRYFVSFESRDVSRWSGSTKKVVFESGPHGAFDCAGVFSPQVYKFGGLFYLFYGGTDGRKAYTGLAVGKKPGGRWARLASMPILSPGESGDWDEVNSLIVSVIRLDDCYCAFYEGEDSRRMYSIGMAWSKDLVNWVKWEKNPVISPGSASYCEHMVCGPRAFSDGKSLYIFFNGHGKDMRGSCGLAIFRGDG
ncbi:MAG: hypothetical protein IT362_04725 [Deltaproteobacteria bacterium]|nr:hypothetical protein [Deltaproteobacteria bacterium]